MPRIFNSTEVALLMSKENEENIPDSDSEVPSELSSSLRENYNCLLRQENARLKKEVDMLRKHIANLEGIPSVRGIVDDLIKLREVATNDNPQIVNCIETEDCGTQTVLTMGDMEQKQETSSPMTHLVPPLKQHPIAQSSPVPEASFLAPTLSTLPPPRRLHSVTSKFPSFREEVNFSVTDRKGFTQLHRDFSVWIPTRQFLNVNNKNPRSMVRDILTVAFTRQYMTNHTVSGRKGNSSSACVKPAMHHEFLMALTHTVKEHHSISEKEVWTLVAKNLQSESNMFSRTPN